ncbi:MAG: hypothetical protein AB8G95_00975 [Anaerolineae bacterium]
MGFITLILAVVGLISGFQKKPKNFGRNLVFFVALILALGPVLKLNGRIIEFELVQWLNSRLWQLGHLLKPDVFIEGVVPEAYLNSIPLPGYLFIVLVSFWEGARASARFAFVAFLGALGFAANGLDRLPKWVRWVLMLVWLIEFLPATTGSQPLDFEEIHPAHSWLGEQAFLPGEGVLDFQTQIIHGPTPLYTSWQTKIPTASAIGSFRPA